MRHANTNAVKRGESSPDLCTESYPMPVSHKRYEAVVAETSKAKAIKATCNEKHQRQTLTLPRCIYVKLHPMGV